jgi:hypothetical protein
MVADWVAMTWFGLDWKKNAITTSKLTGRLIGGYTTKQVQPEFYNHAGPVCQRARCINKWTAAGTDRRYQSRAKKASEQAKVHGPTRPTNSRARLLQRGIKRPVANPHFTPAQTVRIISSSD